MLNYQFHNSLTLKDRFFFSFLRVLECLAIALYITENNWNNAVNDIAEVKPSLLGCLTQTIC